jgi:hypothetical protein
MMGAESRRRPDQRSTRDPSFSEQREDFAIKEIVASSRVLVQMNWVWLLWNDAPNGRI